MADCFPQSHWHGFGAWVMPTQRPGNVISEGGKVERFILAFFALERGVASLESPPMTPALHPFKRPAPRLLRVHQMRVPGRSSCLTSTSASAGSPH